MFELNKIYNFSELETIVYEYEVEKFNLEEIGEFAIGSNFIVLTSSNDYTVSFVLTGYNVHGSFYKCIYKD
jgi:hypothetical protein